MQFVEVAVNVPIRPTFSKRHQTPPPESEITLSELPDPSAEEELISVHFPSIAPKRAAEAMSGSSTLNQTPRPQQRRGLRTFHYHLPPELEQTVRLGHLVWVPFGHQELQGIVTGMADHAPVQTKAIVSLARPQPVLNEIQLELADWIADTYVASFSEALKLFLPPGLLSKSRDERSRARAKRELQIELLADPADFNVQLLAMGKENHQVRILLWLYHNPNAHLTIAELSAELQLRSSSPFDKLVEKGAISLNSDESGLKRLASPRLTQPLAETASILRSMRGTDKYLAVLETLAEAGRPLWKSELYERVDADLKLLRTLQTAGLIQLSERNRFRDPLSGRIYPRTSPPTLTDDQEKVWQTLQTFAFSDPTVETRNPHAQDKAVGNIHHGTKFLLHGVTGSGKTEVYLRAIGQTLEAGKQAIVLVPEIALTPQTVARFAGRFPNRVTVIHSGLSQGERFDVWRRLQASEYDIVIGPRSALFAPMSRLGLIVIDEEHESSYKQSAEAWGSFTVFYDARAVAIRLAELTNSTLIMGSATPSLESYYAADNSASTPSNHKRELALQSDGLAFVRTESNRLVLLEMPRRVMGHNDAGETLYADLPPVELVDMRQELRSGNRSILSRSLQSELHATLDRGEQAILFLNRRGTRTFVLCRDCGHVIACNRCDVPLTYHERANVLICHHCNQRTPIPTECPECGSKRIKYFGSGTQRLEELVTEIAPRARVLRWDADTTSQRGSHETILAQFANREADVMVGTQMIAKGLDLPMVTLVGVVAADSALYLPDFRSAERTFQLLTQVAGRAGRSDRGGRVIIQTYTPEHYAIQAAAQHDYHGFYEREMRFREQNGYPPLQRLLRLVYWDKDLEKAQHIAEQMAATLRHKMEQDGLTDATHRILGPAPAFFSRFRGYYRWQVLIKSANPAAFLAGITIPFGWRIDVDPLSLL